MSFFTYAAFAVGTKDILVSVHFGYFKTNANITKLNIKLTFSKIVFEIILQNNLAANNFGRFCHRDRLNLQTRKCISVKTLRQRPCGTPSIRVA